MGEDTLCQALLVHGQGVHMEIFNSVLDFFQQVLVHAALHVADGDVRVGALAGLHDLHGEIYIPDPAADQSGVEDQGLHEAIPGSTEDLVLLRLRDPAGRVSTAVDEDRSVIPVDQETGEAGEELCKDIFIIGLHGGLAVMDVLLCEIMGR